MRLLGQRQATQPCAPQHSPDAASLAVQSQQQVSGVSQSNSAARLRRLECAVGTVSMRCLWCLGAVADGHGWNPPNPLSLPSLGLRPLAEGRRPVPAPVPAAPNFRRLPSVFVLFFRPLSLLHRKHRPPGPAISLFRSRCASPRQAPRAASRGPGSWPELAWPPPRQPQPVSLASRHRSRRRPRHRHTTAAAPSLAPPTPRPTTVAAPPSGHSRAGRAPVWSCPLSPARIGSADCDLACVCSSSC